MAQRCYLLTGASGFVGNEVLRAIARLDPEARTYATLRAPPGELESRAARLGWRGLPHVVPIGGDLTRTRAGLSPRDLERVASEVTHVIHAGASVRFDDDIHRARQTNVAGTRHLLELAPRMRQLERFVHVSTTFVCGDRPGSLVEGPAPRGRFRNVYERTKFEAEEVVQRAMVTLPVTVVRPSIVAPALGSDADDAAAGSRLDGTPRSRPGDAAQQRARFVLLLQLYLTHGWHWVPGNPSSIVDMVPADLVARATIGLAQRPLSDGRWYHLAAGARSSTVRELGTMANRRFATRPLSFAPPRLFHAAMRCLVWGQARPMLDRAAPYVPYLSVKTRVDTTDSLRVLRELGIEVPRVVDQFSALLGAFDVAAGSRSVAATRPPARFSAGRASAAAAPRVAARRS
jgi:nucleoside-diphosphate-sugar epimerase